MRICLIVDSIERDLDGLIKLSLNLLKNGSEVYLTPMGIQVYDLIRIAPDFILINYLRDNNIENVRKYINAGIQVGVLDTEGAIFTDISKSLIASLKRNQCEISLYFTWGDIQRKTILDAGIFCDNVVFSTGSPRYDFYSHNYQNIVYRDWSYSLKGDYRGLILFNTNYPILFSKFQSIEDEIRMISKASAFEDSEIRKNIRSLYSAWVETIRAIEEVSNTFKDYKIVVRPHPFEKKDIYETLTKDLKNVFVLQEGSVLKYLVQSDILIHRDCTTAVEAYILGKTAISIEWVLCDGKRQKLPTDVSLQARSLSDLIFLINSTFQGKTSNRSSITVNNSVYEFFGNIDGKASERISDIINDKIKRKKKYSQIRAGLRKEFYRSFPEIIKYCVINVFYFIFYSFFKKKYLRLDKKLCLGYVNNRIMKISELDGFDMRNVLIERINNTSSLKVKLKV